MPEYSAAWLVDGDFALQAVAEAIALHVQVVRGLEVQPEAVGGAEEPGEAKRGVGGDGARAVEVV